jgi:hypothetical protein
MSSRRSLLSQLTGAPLEKPCDVPWDAMRGGERFRVCAECDREVWNLSAMTAREAEIRLLNASGSPCINYRVDEAGRLISREEPRALTARRLGLGAAAFVASTLVAPGHGSLSGSVAAAADQQPAKQPDKAAQNEKPKTKKQSDKDQSFKPGDCPDPGAVPGTTALNPRPQPPLGGAPPRPRDLPPAGNVELKSATPRDVSIDGVSFHVPATIRLPPGKHEAQLKDGTKLVKRTFEVKLDGTFVLDLDR